MPNGLPTGQTISRFIPAESFNNQVDLGATVLLAGDVANAVVSEVVGGLQVDYTIPLGFENEYLWLRAPGVSSGPSSAVKLNYTISPPTPSLDSTVGCIVCGFDKTFDVVTGQSYPSWGRTSIQIVSPPSVGTAVVDVEGRISYSAPPNYSGSVSIQFTALDEFGVRSSPATLAIDVSCTAQSITTEVC